MELLHSSSMTGVRLHFSAGNFIDTPEFPGTPTLFPLECFTRTPQNSFQDEDETTSKGGGRDHSFALSLPHPYIRALNVHPWRKNWGLAGKFGKKEAFVYNWVGFELIIIMTNTFLAFSSANKWEKGWLLPTRSPLVHARSAQKILVFSNTKTFVQVLILHMEVSLPYDTWCGHGSALILLSNVKAPVLKINGHYLKQTDISLWHEAV